MALVTGSKFCKACGKPVEWHPTAGGSSMPIDPEPHAEGVFAFDGRMRLARVHLPVGRYSRMRATSNLRGWLGFLALRMAPGAQWEIRQYANVVGELIAERFPRTWALFSEGRR